MPDVSLYQSSANNGTVTPATPGSLTSALGDTFINVVAVLGTSPTITNPAGWGTVANVAGAALSVAMFQLLNTSAGGRNPSCTLGGTVTGWVSVQFAFNGMAGANTARLFANSNALALAQLINIFSTFGQLPPNPELFVYAVARATATLTPQNTGINWSNSVQPISGVQGLSLDFFWGSSLQQKYGDIFGGSQNFTLGGPPYSVSASGLLGAAVNSVAIGGVYNSGAGQNVISDIIFGNAGQYVGAQTQGMIGG